MFLMSKRLKCLFQNKDSLLRRAEIKIRFLIERIFICKKELFFDIEKNVRVDDFFSESKNNHFFLKIR